MFIPNAVRRLIGLIKVVESGKYITISGLPGQNIVNDILSVWDSSKITNSVFSKIGKDELVFHRWFAPDVAYMLERLIKEKKKGYHIRAMKNVLHHLYTQTWLKDTFAKQLDILDFSKIQSMMTITPQDHQYRFLNNYNIAVPRFKLNGFMLGAGAGTGKASRLGAFIKTPGGWSTMGQMKVGTEITTPKGGVTKVTGVFPQGLVDIYRMTFADGRFTEVCGDHLWKVHLRNEQKKGYWLIKSTKEIMNSTSFLSERAYIPLTESENIPDISLPVDPYILGVILGDGCITDGGSIKITHPDTFIKDKVANRLDFTMRIGDMQPGIDYSLIGRPRGYNTIVRELRTLGLMGKNHYTKFVPEMYLMASHCQRVDLLNGLLDTDGTTDKSGSASFCSTSFKLAEAVQYLVRSIGGIANISIKNPVYTYLGIKHKGRIAYQVNIRHKYPEELFTLPKKKERVSNTNQYAETLKLRIDKIEYIGKHEAQCISVADEDHLYITDGFIVTHNTIMGLTLGVTAGANQVIIICPKNAVHRVWQDTIRGTDKTPSVFRKVPKIWTSLDGTEPPHGLSHYIVHFDAMEKFLHYMSSLGLGKTVILLDESHNLNDIESFRVQTFIQIVHAAKCENVLWQSGTPVKALGGETAPLFSTIDPMFDEEVRARFKVIYGISSGRANDILAARLGKVTFKIGSDTVVQGKPEFKDINVKLPNGHKYTLEAIRTEIRSFAKERSAYYVKNMKHFEERYEIILKIFSDNLKTTEDYDKLKLYKSYIKKIRKSYNPGEDRAIATYCRKYEDEVIAPALPSLLKKEFRSVRTVVKYYQLKVLGEALGQVLGKKRAECITEMIPYIGLEKCIDNAEKKTVIFTSYVSTLEACEKYLKEAGYKPVLVYGKTSNDLAAHVGTFDKDEDANPLVATYACLSSAVPLIMANEMIMLNSPFRSYEYDQAVARTYRLGQDTQVVIWNVFLDTGSEPNLSTRNKTILDWSRKQVEEIMNFKAGGLSMECYQEIDVNPDLREGLATPIVKMNGMPTWALWGN